MADVKNCVPHLTGPNFPTWKMQWRMALMKDGLWDIVTEEEEGPAQQTPSAIATFKKRKDRALATIVLAISPALLYLIGVDPDDPKEVWEKLMNQFQRESWSNKLNIRRKLYDMKPAKGEPIQNHVKKVTELFDELAVIGYPAEEEERVVHLLASLPEPFDMMVTALESNAEQPSLEYVTERILHEERKIKERMEREGTSENEALVAGNVSSKFSRGPPTCFHCGIEGHIKRNCKKLKQENEAKAKGNKSKKHKSKKKEQAHFSQQTRKKKKERIPETSSSSSDDDESEYESGMVVTEIENPNHEALCEEHWDFILCKREGTDF